jgi:hypothetical protein
MTVSQAFTSAGTTLAIGAAPATYDASGFAAVSFTTVGEITDIGSYGKKYNLVTHMPLADRKTVKRRGSYNNGTLNVKLAKAETSDSGQTAMIAAAASDDSISVKIVLQNGEINYFTAVLMGVVTNVGSVDQITAYECDFEIDNDIVIV